MIERDVALLLIGTTLGVVSSFIGALAQHFLSLRADRVKRERDRKDERLKEMSEIPWELMPRLMGERWPKEPKRKRDIGKIIERLEYRKARGRGRGKDRRKG